MKYLFGNFNKLKREFENKNLFIFLDYDGTLTPMAKKPEDAVISKTAKKTLMDLKKYYNARLSIISGRSLKDIKKLVGIKDIIYAGNYGLEIEGPNMRFKAGLAADYKTVLKEIKMNLTKKLNSIKGAVVEDKGLTVSVHYRLAKCSQLEIKKKTNKILKNYIAGGKVKVNYGKKIIEIKPPIDWHKGSAVLWILKSKAEKNIIPVYIGDDTTDEDAFRILKANGLTVRVGKSKKSEAKYYLKNTEEVIDLLNKILKIKGVKYAAENSKSAV